MHRSLTIFALLLAQLLPAVATAAGSDAQQWLRRMSEAMHTLNYEGRFIFRQGELIDPMHVRHQAVADGGRERLVTLSGEQREIIRNSDGRTCIDSRDSEPFIEADEGESRSSTQILPYETFNEIDQLRTLYKIALDGRERVAGRSAQVISIVPRDNYRYGYRIWVDAENALLLNFMVLDQKGAVLEQMMFTQLELVEQFTPQQLLSESCQQAFANAVVTANRPMTNSDVSSSGWRSERLPSGFSLREGGRTPRGEHVGHLLYSDGLATVSIFIEQSDQARLPDGHHALGGSVNAFAQFVAPYQLVAVGEVPAETVEMMAQSITQSEAATND